MKTMKKRRNQLIFSLLSKKQILKWENSIDFKWSDVTIEDEEDIALANFIENLQKQTNEETSKKVTKWLFDDCSIIPNEKIKKIFLEVISNTKIFNMKFCKWSYQRPRFCQTYRG